MSLQVWRMAGRPTLRSIRFDPIGLINRAFLSLSVAIKVLAAKLQIKSFLLKAFNIKLLIKSFKKNC
jgi:hypothetical protein